MPKDPPSVDTPNDGLPALDKKPMHHTLKLDFMDDWNGSNKQLKHAIKYEPSGGFATCMATCPLENPPTCAAAKQMAGTCAVKCNPAQKDDLLVMATDQPCLFNYLPPSPPPVPFSQNPAQHTPAITGGANEKDPSHPSVKTGKVLGPAEPHVVGGGVCGTSTCGPSGTEPCLDCGDVSSDDGMPKDPPSIDTPNDGLPPLDTNPQHRKL